MKGAFLLDGHMKIEKKIALLASVNRKKTLTLKALTWDEDNKLTLDSTNDDGVLDPNKLSWLRIEKVSGLTVEQVDEMPQPDINSIKNFINSTITKKAEDIAKELDLKFEQHKDSMVKLLLQPLGDGTTSYKLKYPTGKLTKILEQETDDERRTFALCEFCTGLNELQLKSMSTPDWNSLQDILDKFLGKTSEFFRQ